MCCRDIIFNMLYLIPIYCYFCINPTPVGFHRGPIRLVPLPGPRGRHNQRAWQGQDSRVMFPLVLDTRTIMGSSARRPDVATKVKGSQ